MADLGERTPEERRVRELVDQSNRLYERLSAISPEFADALDEFDREMAVIAKRLQSEPENRAVILAEMEALIQQLTNKQFEVLFFRDK